MMMVNVFLDFNIPMEDNYVKSTNRKSIDDREDFSVWLVIAEKVRRFNFVVNVVILDDEQTFAEMLDKQIELHCVKKTSVYKGYKQDKIEMRGDRAEMSDFPLYLNTVAGGLDRRDQTIGGFSFVVKIYAVPVVEIIG